MTYECLIKNVPSDVAGIAFLSGGQSSDLACAHLNRINELYMDKMLMDTMDMNKMDMDKMNVDKMVEKVVEIDGKVPSPENETDPDRKNSINRTKKKNK